MTRTDRYAAVARMVEFRGSLERDAAGPDDPDPEPMLGSCQWRRKFFDPIPRQ
jgi:hypothetical protein